MSDITDLAMKIAYLRGGGGQESSLDKLNRTFSMISGLGDQIRQRKQQEFQNKLQSLQMQNEQQKFEQAKQEAMTLGERFPAPAPGEPITSAADIPGGSMQIPGGTAGMPPPAPSFESRTGFPSWAEKMNPKQVELIAQAKKNLREPDNLKFLYDQEGNVIGAVPKISTQILPSTETLYDPKTGKLIATIPRASKAGQVDVTNEKQTKASKQALNVLDSYYSRLFKEAAPSDTVTGVAEGMAKGSATQIPLVGTKMFPGLKALIDYRQAQGARLAKFAGDSGNIAIQEQKNALKRLAPPGASKKEALAQWKLTRDEILTNLKDAGEDTSQFGTPKEFQDIQQSPAGAGGWSPENEARLQELERRAAEGGRQ